MYSWSRFLAFLLFITPMIADAEEMDFGGDDAPPPEEMDGPPPLEIQEDPNESEESSTPIYVFAVTADEELRQITEELDSALRDSLFANHRYTMSEADSFLNGRSFEANEALQQAELLFDEGRMSYDNLELDHATELFDQALQTYEERIAHVSDLNKISDCYLYLGASEVLRGRTRQARTPFLKLLLIDPERRPDPDIFPPPVTEAFEYVIGQVARVRQGELTVRSEPGGADVFIDGVYQGPAPQEDVPLKAGRHYVRVRQQGYAEAGRVVEVGRRATVATITLEPTDDGQLIAGLLEQLATQVVDSPNAANGTVQHLGEVLNLEVLITAVVVREGEGVRVMLNGWDAVQGESVVQEDAGPYATEAISIIGDIQPTFDDLISSTWTAMNTSQAPIEPVVEPQPDIEPEPMRRPFWQQWWFWTAVGAAVVGASFGIGFGVAAANDGEAPVTGEVILDL